MLESLSLQDWGLIDYALAFQRMLDHVDLVLREQARETVIFCQHPPVVTLGRGTKTGDVSSWSGPRIEVNRGGRATYHGPDQQVVYPILDLSSRGRDLHLYLRTLEDVVARTLRGYQILAEGRSVHADGDGAAREATGVWVGNRKLASIGIGVRKWVTFHGLALNVDRDASAFQGMKPCGFSSDTMISMQEILGRKVDRIELQRRLAKEMQEAFAPCQVVGRHSERRTL